MSVMYCTVAELGNFLHLDLSSAPATASATLAIQIASEKFAKAAHTQFESTAATYSQPGTNAFQIVLPFQPLIAVLQVRITPFGSAAQIVTDYSVIGPSVYRRLGFGNWWRFPPDLVEIDYTHGYTVVPDDVKGAVLESAAMAYDNPDPATTSESIDDYSVKTAPNLGGITLSPSAQMLADYYAGALVA